MLKSSKKKRRPRSAAGDRNYLCGCGKAYLSYPALYTHVKNKHDSIFPIGSNARRKIPRNLEEDTDVGYTQNPETFDKEFEVFLNENSLSNKTLVGPLQSQDLERLRRFGGFVPESDISHLKTGLTFIRDLTHQKIDPEETKEQMTIYQTLVYFLSYIHPNVLPDFYEEYQLLIIMMIRTLNDKGDQFVDKEDKKKALSKIEDSKLPFCQSNMLNIVVEIINHFIAEPFPILLKTLLKDHRLSYLSFSEDGIKNLIVMLKYLANWMFHFDFTEFRFEVNGDL